MVALGSALCSRCCDLLVEYLANARARPSLYLSAYASWAMIGPHSARPAGERPSIPRLRQPTWSRRRPQHRCCHELAGAEVTALFATLEPATAGYATLLLCGISPYELPVLHAACFDPPNRAISVPAGGRSFIVAPSVRLTTCSSTWPKRARYRSRNSIDGSTAAQQAQLADAAAVTAGPVVHVYHLPGRQGSMSQRSPRVGIIPAPVLDALAQYCRIVTSAL